MSSQWDEDSDADILELANKPPRGTQLTQIESHAETETCGNDESGTGARTHEDLDKLQMDLMTARGESGMLRDRLMMLQQEKDRERERLLGREQELQGRHLQELQKLQEELQRLEDEKQFLVLEKRQLVKGHIAAGLPAQDIQDDSTEVSAKRRKTEDSLVQTYVTLNHTRVVTGDSSLFLDHMVLFKLHGSDMTVLDMLDHISLESPASCSMLVIPSGEPLGKPIHMMLLRLKSMHPLDKMIDIVLENLAMLIKKIMQGKDCRFAVPFLVAYMHQALSFRPSAVHVHALKDLFQFSSDLAIKFQPLLKSPLHASPLELGVEPNIFQYELLDTLSLFYCFDVMELCVKYLLQCSPESQKSFFDEIIWKNITKVMQLSLTISYKSILNVVFSMVEILRALSELITPEELSTVQWWDSAISKLFQLWNRQVSNANLHDNDNLHVLPKHNFPGLNRCLGDSTNVHLIEELIDTKAVQAIPEVIYRDFPPFSRECKIRIEGWGLQLHKATVNILQQLLLRYGKQLAHAELLHQTAKFLCREQELLLVVRLTADSHNSDMRITLAEELIRLLYHAWQEHEEPSKAITEVQNELIACLWRVVFGHMSNRDPQTQPELDALLLDSFHGLSLKEQHDLYDDVFDQPAAQAFLARELAAENVLRCETQFSGCHAYTCREMAKSVLESIISLEDTDSLFLAMVSE
ncbi:AFR687Wp [Eremothecium gossypii ATCC 10895]|uniref:DNA damage checkpoint protein LCD1 n=1 Tax=Eremothecium gossypii (strain ATCC 10895 / CBS 109.51 / FGSC 9923 / NRRL Y-1056) TaxID=284811 RepID=LCD1_EREGS|nr:AFR687Wp [Eremothecium gossypii ATCC 10895]Q751Y8.1 RecName: Full=DNA damage checkpoint protein LCD1 [Eremothecium gossypii ATCC 10895]AAS54059.1 AFR687Wp [Eremothecium gossypii ATCC 10895]AEY98374.1 FAFR687Wp [Eremothecium gossypii FDAG1]